MQNGCPQYYFLNQHLQEYENDKKWKSSHDVYSWISTLQAPYKRKKKQQKQSPVMMCLHI